MVRSALLFSQVRAAGCVWLVALASFTRRPRALLGRLGELHEAFSALLGDAGETTPEMASRGLSVVYTLGDRGAQEQLLASLMGTLQGAALAPGRDCLCSRIRGHPRVGCTGLHAHGCCPGSWLTVGVNNEFETVPCAM